MRANQADGINKLFIIGGAYTDLQWLSRIIILFFESTPSTSQSQFQIMVFNSICTFFYDSFVYFTFFSNYFLTNPKFGFIFYLNVENSDEFIFRWIILGFGQKHLFTFKIPLLLMNFKVLQKWWLCWANTWRKTRWVWT